MHLHFCYIFVILLLTTYPVFSANCRLKDQVSIVLPKTKLQCFRLLNGTHQTGCQSEKNGNSGTVIDVESFELFMTQLEFFKSII
uniref:Nicastrin small lobe domain-containing protein n=1 Tax=Panagrolaimus sp. PS1159 TaxID=55785 RepID=A0AC35EYE5_9BILA